MTVKYYALLTTQGAAKLANAAALGTKLQITQMAVGDGGGKLPTPNASQTALIGEQRRAPLNQLSIDTANASQIIAEQIIPETDGGFWIREIGLFDADGTMIAVANCAETYKPQLQEGSGRTQTVRMILIVSSTEAVTLKIDPSVVLATRKYVDDAVIEVKTYADGMMKKHTEADNPHSQYLQIANALGELKDAKLIADVLKNLGLGEAAKRGVGSAANQLPDMSSFSSGTNWFSLPSGHIVQFFSALINGADTNGTETPYPFRFPSQMIACSVLWSDSTTSSAPTFKIMGNLSSAGAARIKASASSGQYGILIIAVGK